MLESLSLANNINYTKTVPSPDFHLNFEQVQDEQES